MSLIKDQPDDLYDPIRALWGYCAIDSLTKRIKHNHMLCECPRCAPIIHTNPNEGHYLCTMSRDKYVLRSYVKDKEIKDG